MESVEFHVLVEDIMVAMRDGVRLCGDLYLPAVDGKVPSGHRWPCVLVRTPYNKSVSNPDFRHPGHYWTQNGYTCFIQDCRGRFKSEGEFYKYTGEAADGYDTVEWIAIQSWCNGNVVTDGPSYLCHVQTSMAILRPPHLKAMFCNKGGFFNAHTSGVRQGGCYEARQWIWGIKHAPRKTPALKLALENIEKNLGAWLERYPFKKGDSPLTLSPEYEDYIFDQVEKADYGDYWKQIGLNTEEYLDEFADIPAVFLSGWYDIYCRSTVDFFVNLVKRKKGPILLIMGPWQHVGAEGHVAGEVDFGVQALISGNLAPTVFSLSRRWFDRFVDPVMIDGYDLTPTTYDDMMSTSNKKLDAVIAAAEQIEEKERYKGVPRGPYTSFSRMSLDVPATGPSLYISPTTLPRSTREPVEPLPPHVRYFRMGGGDGHRTQQGMMFHGGVWMAADTWPPTGNEPVNFFLQKRSLIPGLYNSQLSHISSPLSAITPPQQLLHASQHVSYFAYDPSNPCPTIGGNLFAHGNVLLGGAYDQIERPDMFLCKPPYLPLSSRRDVVIFRTEPLITKLDVTGQPYVILYISSSCVDTDFTAKLIDEYPPSQDYPHGFAMAVTHGIQRCRYRHSREKQELMEPGKIYEIRIDLYPTSNLFNVGHRLRLDISSSNFPHFDLNLNTGDDPDSQRMMIAENSIWHHASFPSRIVLPIQRTTQPHQHHQGKL